MAKQVTTRPEWIKADCVADIYSVSGCVSSDFADYIKFWKHNGYWYFDTPQLIWELAQKYSIDLNGNKLFFYEAYEREFDDDRGNWVDFKPDRAFKTQVLLPTDRELEGYDVVTFSLRTIAECSPLSCNSLATDVRTNQHCLLPSLDNARQLLEEGKFKNTEPGPFRIFAVYSTEWPHPVLGTASSCTG